MTRMLDVGRGARAVAVLLVLWIYSGCTNAYFPNHPFAADKFYMQKFRSLGEGPLARSSESEVFRVYAGDHDHQYVVKVALREQGALLGAWIDEERTDNAARSFDWTHLRKLAEEASYWELSIDVERDTIQLHGSTCIVERFERGRYHVVRRERLTVTPEFAALCHQVLSLAGFPPVFEKYAAPAQPPQ